MSIGNRSLISLLVIAVVCHYEFQMPHDTLLFYWRITESAGNRSSTGFIDGQTLGHGFEQHKLPIYIALV